MFPIESNPFTIIIVQGKSSEVKEVSNSILTESRNSKSAITIPQKVNQLMMSKNVVFYKKEGYKTG